MCKSIPYRLVAAFVFGGLATSLAGYNVELKAKCQQTVFSATDPVRCEVELVNHGTKGHPIYVPSALFPRAVQTWPTAILELEIENRSTGKLVPNEFLRAGTLDLAQFKKADLWLLDVDRMVGWDLDLRNGGLWTFQLPAGEYDLRARVKVGILKLMKNSPKFKAMVAEVLGSRAKNAEALILDGELLSNRVQFTVR